MKSGVTLLAAVAIAAALYLGLPLDSDLRTGLAILSLIALLWITETFHITVTALLVPSLAVIGGVFSVREALTEFANPIIFLFLGGFALAAALRQQRLDSLIAGHLLRLAGGRLQRASLMLFGCAALLSMWISNTATTAMMLPLVLGLLEDIPYKENRRTWWFLLLGTAYSANIGGIGTLVGSPPNAIAAAATGISFAEWLSFGIPVVLLMLPLMVITLWLLLRPDLSQMLTISHQPSSLNLSQRLTLAVFLLTVCGWLSSRSLGALLGIDGGLDSQIAILALILLCAMKLVSWKTIEQSADWGVLLLFGGGLTLSAVLKATGTSIYLAELITLQLAGAPLLLFLLAVCLFVVMLTEIASNTASSALLIPIFISVAEAMSLPPQVLAVMIAVAASCAFMLPVATPPNAIVFGSGFLPQRQMMRAGIFLNILLATLIAAAVRLML